MSRKHLGVLAIFGVPLILGVLSLIGLVGALLADGALDWIGAILPGVSLAVIGWARFGRRRPGGRD